MAGGYVSFPSVATRMKRKEAEDVSDDFSDFSLTSPARKIRRLEAGLPPIVEEEDMEPNTERAIVLFNPHGQLHTQSPSSNFSVNLSPNFISGIKNRIFGFSEDCQELPEPGDEEESQGGGCMAVVPWRPNSYAQVVQAMGGGDNDNQTEAGESMEGEATMEIDDDNSNSSSNINNSNYGSLGFGLSQWQQQHCMPPPQLPSNTTTPITWFR
ncbi:hypothetical protein Tsubulata_044290 [Turnera subulata]|uniref:Uncharacterized protein n=1 Tax=Turnera subulata TaxID=218843 RepID=A0A9Q0JRI7_9ROSI|nr:hypothetical protein Tsubulata_044290 [Turnera subulata]